MKICFFDLHEFEKPFYQEALKQRGWDYTFQSARLEPETVALAQGSDVACCFTNDTISAPVLEKLKAGGVRLIALRAAGYNNVDLAAAARLDLPVVRVPAYSPAAVAEHAVALMLTLNRKIHRAYNRVRELNFSLDGLVGFDMQGKTVGIIGVGRIGQCAARIMRGFGCNVLLSDVQEDREFANSIGARYASLDEILKSADIITLHCPLTPQTRHMIGSEQIAKMKPNVLLINTGRGALIDSRALIDALKHHRIGGAGLDVYEEEASVFFTDHSQDGIDDDLLARFLTFPNVVMTSHQGFLTNEALAHIAETTFANITEFERGERLTNKI